MELDKSRLEASEMKTRNSMLDASIQNMERENVDLKHQLKSANHDISKWVNSNVCIAVLCVCVCVRICKNGYFAGYNNKSLRFLFSKHLLNRLSKELKKLRLFHQSVMQSLGETELSASIRDMHVADSTDQMEEV